jgi:hypothetical protein
MVSITALKKPGSAVGGNSSDLLFYPEAITPQTQPHRHKVSRNKTPNMPVGKVTGIPAGRKSPMLRLTVCCIPWATITLVKLPKRERFQA